jgi:hypothetical protein
VAVVPLAYAAPPLGNASSRGDFKIDSALLKVRGTPTWPVSDGQTVESMKTNVAVTLPGLAEFALCPNSRVRVTQSGTRITIDLTAGSLTWKQPKPGTLLLQLAGKPGKADTEEGTVSMLGAKAPKEGCAAGPAGLTTKQKVLLGTAIAAGGGAAIGLGVAGGGGGTPPPVSVRQ